jgi:GNAT superfamily N-acetyltransferase
MSLPQPDAIVRPAIEDDIPNLYDMCRRFIAETELPLTLSESGTIETFAKAIHRPSAILVVWESQDVLGGMVLGYVEKDFCEESCAYINKFYVEREFRGLGVSDELLAAFDAEALDRGAKVSFASATAGMGPTVEKLYVRLFERRGYNVLGRVLVKELA